jgi:hypothetical protein
MERQLSLWLTGDAPELVCSSGQRIVGTLHTNERHLVHSQASRSVVVLGLQSAEHRGDQRSVDHVADGALMYVVLSEVRVAEPVSWTIHV